MNDLTKNILLWVVIVFVLLLVFSRYMPAVGQPQEIPYSQFLNDVKAGRVDSVVMQGGDDLRQAQGLRPTSRPAIPRPTTPP